ncbi:hypothetical protein A2U01_0002284 [Trifolium medium]|uniref:Uncharacterized protein n=1 Tax=Trifolium medium TaxID=97028 RepID=A0A392M2J8_9FABA|nr:hypothetical protein [Trifolium medium]
MLALSSTCSGGRGTQSTRKDQEDVSNPSGGGCSAVDLQWQQRDSKYKE